MDGVLLVLDSRNLPNPQALAPVRPARVKAQPKRNRAVPAFATLILALVLGMVYYVSIHRRAAQNADIPAVSVAATSEPVSVVNPTPQSQEVQAPAPEAPKPEPAKQPEPKPGKKQLVKTASNTQSKTESEPKKDDSRVGSILKKTGRILKKPFKF